MKESLSPYIDSFLTMIAVEKGLAKNTVEAYSRDLARLSEFLVAQSVASWGETETLHLRSYFSGLRRQGLSPRSIGRHIVTVRRFYGFLETEGVVNENPVPRFHQVAGGESCRRPCPPRMFENCWLSPTSRNLLAPVIRRCSNCCMPRGCGFRN